MSEIAPGYCLCGCGKKTVLVPYGSKSRGWIKGTPLRFIHGHNSKGNNNPSWNGGVSKNSFGHKLIKIPNHHRADKHGYTPEHNLIAERALKKPLPPKSVVHHHTPNQLVICENQGYHLFLHRRTRAYYACGHADWFKCCYCKQYDDSENMYVYSNKGRAFHRHCHNEYEKVRQARHREGVKHFTAEFEKRERMRGSQ